MKKILLLLTAFVSIFYIKEANSQAFTFTAGNLVHTQNFDGMGPTGTTYLTGWNAVRYAGTGTIGQVLTMAVTDGGANSGNVYNVGTTAATERAFGSIASGSTVPRYGASFANNTGTTITSLTLAGMMEQWRSGSSNTVTEIVAFEYSTNATDLQTGTWTAVSTFDLVEKLTTTTTAALVDGNLPANQTAINAFIALTWANATTIWIRWSDTDASGSDCLLAIDNLSITASTTPVTNITVTSPLTGNIWRQGTTHNITWTASNTNANVKIEYSDNASSGTPIWVTLNPSIAASAGTWTWNIPAGQALSTDCKIRITDIPQTYTASSGTFIIGLAPVTVTNLAALRAGTAGTVYKYAGLGILTFKQTFRNQKFIQDATAAVLIDDNAAKLTTPYVIGDALTNIIGTVAEFDGMLQFTPESDAGAPASTGNVITPEVVTLNQLNTSWENYEAELIKVSNLTFTGATGNFANGTVYPVADAGAVTGNFRTTFSGVDYIGTPVPTAPVDLVVLPNSRIDGNFITSRNLADIVVLVPSITVTSPNGGQFYQQGSTQTITWVSSNFTGNVKIELTGANASVIAASVPNTGNYTWNISPTQVVATDYKVKISDAADGSPADESNNTFAIVAPYTVPNLVITEIMYNSPGSDEEWIEIYNNGSTTIDMSYYYILDDDPTHIADPLILPSGASIAPGGRYTVEVATAGAFPFVPSYNGSGKISFTNSTDQVKLYHRFGNLIDSVKYQTTAPWPTGPNGGGSSLTFCDPSQDNSIATYWSASNEPFQTLQNTTIYATPGTGCYVSNNNIMITEIMYNPIDGGNDTIEFIEVYNKGTIAANLKDWYFSKGVTYTFPDYTLAPNSYYVVAREAGAMLNTFGITCPQWTDGFLDDSGEPIVLKDGIGQVKDSVYYLPTAPWPTTPNNGGPSLTFCNTTLDNSLGENWSASTNQVAVNGLGQPIYASPGASCSSGAKLVMTEIMYNPPESGTDSLEFIELYNIGNPVDLQNFTFSTGVVYTFPSVTLANGEYLLVAANSAAIQNTFGKASLQWTSGGLSNSGEAITLKDNFGVIIDDVTYGTTMPWDSLANGHGPSLTLCDPASNNSQAINWKASTELAATNAAGVKIYATPLGGCVNPPTVANFEGTPTFLIAGGFVQFTDLSTNTPISWSWTFPGGTPATSTLQNPQVQYNTAGVYSVTLTATNAYGTSTLTIPNYIGVGGVGITMLPSEIAVYPNPTSGKISITNPNKDEQQIVVYSNVGKPVASVVSTNELINVDISGQTKGLYMARITNTSTKITQVVKIILN